MSKFDELCLALGAVRGQYQTYRLECLEFVGRFVTGLIEYLQAPPDHVALYAKYGSYAGRKVDGPAAALVLHDDAYWHFGVVIDLYEEEGLLPYHSVGFDVRLKKLDDDFILRIDELTELTIPVDDQGQASAAYDQMFALLKSRYADSFRQFMSSGDTSKRFGF